MNLIGKRYGRLLVVSFVGKDEHRNLEWLCHCDCGKTTIQRTNTLNMGLVQSCGCLRHKGRFSEANGMWRGDDVGINAIHRWVESRKSKPLLCECCGLTKPQDLANISGEYKRDINDYEWLCRKCHMIKDNRMSRREVNGQFQRVN